MKYDSEEVPIWTKAEIKQGTSISYGSLMSMYIYYTYL